MGLFSGIASFVSNAVSTIGGAVSSLLGGSSSSSSRHSRRSYSEWIPSPTISTTTTTNHNTTPTTYEPDRVKAAQLENERVELMRQAQLEIIEAQTRSRIAQEQARAQGFAAIAQAITTMQEKLNDIAERRIAIIERGTLQAVKEAEEFYSELAAKIQADNDAYTLEKLPALLEILGRYEDESPAQKLYMKKIDEDMSLQVQHTARQLESVVKRQDRLIDEILTAKGKIADQTAQITAGMLEAMQEKLTALDAGVPQLQTYGGEIPALPE